MGSQGLIADALWVIQDHKKGNKKSLLLFSSQKSLNEKKILNSLNFIYS